MIRRPPRSTLFPYNDALPISYDYSLGHIKEVKPDNWEGVSKCWYVTIQSPSLEKLRRSYGLSALPHNGRSEEHTSELQSLAYLVCRLLLEKKKNTKTPAQHSV